MGKMNWRLVGSGLLLGGLVGCSNAPSRPPITDLKEGVNLLDVRDPSFGMSAAYVKDQRVVFHPVFFVSGEAS